MSCRFAVARLAVPEKKHLLTRCGSASFALLRGMVQNARHSGNSSGPLGPRSNTVRLNNCSQTKIVYVKGWLN